MPLAYVISAYRYPEQLERLVRAIGPSASVIAVHVDRGSPREVHREVRSRLGPAGPVILLDPHPSPWGGFGHVRASLKGIDAALDSGAEFTHVVLLTGQDYPIKPLSQIERFLSERAQQSFIEHFPIPAGDRWREIRGGLERIEPLWLSIGARQLRVPARRRPPYGLSPWGGSAYWAITREAAEEVRRTIRERPRLVRFFRRTRVPDELFFQTVLANSPLRATLANDDLRFVGFDPGASSPRVLTGDDYGALAGASETALFARKFDPTVDAAILDRLDRLISG